MSLTYGELDGRANQIAESLIQVGVGPDKFVGICLERSIEMIVALVAVVKAGGAYIWLDPGYPHDRLEFLIADATPVTCITRSSLLQHLPPKFAKQCLCLDVLEIGQPKAQTNKLDVEGSLDDLTYIVYTSGSTGQPKGVAMTERVLLNLLQWQFENWTGPAPARTLQFASLNFDVSFQEIFSTLCAGGTLVLTSEEIRRGPAELLRLMRTREVERIFLPFVALQQLAAAFESEPVTLPALRDVITAGEELQVTPQVKKFFEALPHSTLHNQYGPAETHVVTALTLRGQPDKWPLRPTIGKPISGAKIYLLDEHQRPVLDGQIGEICVGGLPLARGYLKRPQLTAERFVDNRIDPAAGRRLYRTGDLGSLHPDGNIQFHGRRDQQVKIRGVRVELGETEAVIAEHPEVLQVAVCARPGPAGEQRLVAYVVPKVAPIYSTSVLGAELRRFLTAKLPSQLVPSAFVLLTAIPQTPSGKVDRLTLTSLPDDSALRLDDSEVSERKPPATEFQKSLLEIWENLLDRKGIGIQDDFFDLGGNSLLAIQLTVEISKRLAKKVPTALVFRSPTIEALAGELDSGSDLTRKVALHEFQPRGSKPPFFCAPGFVDLARQLGSDQPFYGLNLGLIDEISSVETGIQEWADRCVSEIRKVQPCGPYFLGGSTGAAGLAFEVARQLQAAGDSIGLLAFFDPAPPPGSAPRSPLRKLAFDLRYLFSLSLNEQIEYIASRLDRWKVYFVWRIRTLADPAARRVRGIDASLRRSRRRGFFANLVQHLKVQSPGRTPTVRDSVPHQDSPLDSWQHKSKKLIAPVVVFLPHDSYLRDKPEQDPRHDWKHMIKGTFDVHEVPGRTSTYMIEPNVKIVARILQTHLHSLDRSIANACPGLAGAFALFTSSVVVGCS